MRLLQLEEAVVAVVSRGGSGEEWSANGLACAIVGYLNPQAAGTLDSRDVIRVLEMVPPNALARAYNKLVGAHALSGRPRSKRSERDGGFQIGKRAMREDTNVNYYTAEYRKENKTFQGGSMAEAEDHANTIGYGEKPMCVREATKGEIEGAKSKLARNTAGIHR